MPGKFRRQRVLAPNQRSLRLDRSERLKVPAYFALPKISVPFVPPKPNEFFTA